MSGAVVRLPPHKASLLALLRLECLRVLPLLVPQCLPLVALHLRDRQRTGDLSTALSLRFTGQKLPTPC